MVCGDCVWCKQSFNNAGICMSEKSRWYHEVVEYDDDCCYCEQFKKYKKAYIVEWGKYSGGITPVTKIRTRKFKTFEKAKEYRAYIFKKMYGLAPATYYKKYGNGACIFRGDIISIFDTSDSARTEFRIYEEDSRRWQL